MYSNISLINYTIDFEISEKSIWLQYHHIKKEHGSGWNKVHISIQHDISTLKKAQDLILPLLAKHEICCFKTQNANLFYSHENLDGKEFCIYMQVLDKNSQESTPEFWIDLLNEIETTLEKNDIPMHPKGALGDLLFPGSKGYVYFRNPQNISGNYIAAALLMNTGFTRKEACEISTNDFFHGYSLSNGDLNWIGHEAFTSRRFELPNGFGEVDNQLKQSILDSFHNQLTKNDRLLQLFVGSQKGYCYTGNLCDQLFGTKLITDRKSKVFELASSGQLDLIKPFEKYLDTAAEQLAKLSYILNHNGYCFDPQKIGSILPALYFNFYMPLYRLNPYGEITTLNDSNEKKLIDEIIRCSLRDINKIAIGYELPQYIHEMNQEDISTLLTFVNVDQKIVNQLPLQEIVHPPKVDVSSEKEDMISNKIARSPIEVAKNYIQLDLKKHQDQFKILHVDLQEIIEELERKREINPEKYEIILLTARSLSACIKKEADHFFANPTLDAFFLFKTECHNAIDGAVIEFEKHRGYWHQIHPVLRGILGVIAALTIIPAFVVEVTTKQGYVQTFFATPKTNLAIKFSKIKEKFDEEEKELEQKINQLN